MPGPMGTTLQLFSPPANLSAKAGDASAPGSPAKSSLGYNDWANRRLDRSGAGKSAAGFSSGDILSFVDGDILSFADGDILSFADGDILSFADGDILSFVSFGGALHGTVGLDADGNIRYSPDGSYFVIVNSGENPDKLLFPADGITKPLAPSVRARVSSAAAPS